MTVLAGAHALCHGASIASAGTAVIWRALATTLRQVPLGAFIAHMSGADFFGLVVSVLVIGYLFYALIRGEKL
jgi:K+-transporting ATPase KdpF subunit